MPAGASGPPEARLLDLSRLVSRVGRGPWTGIDRVEAAWLAHLVTLPAPLFGIVRTSSAFTLVDRGGIEALAARLDGRSPWGRADARARLRLKARPALQAAESDLRRLALARAGKRGLAAMLAEKLPAGSAWLAFGHANLVPDMFAALRGLGGRAAVLIHDAIPLDFPAYQRPGTVAGFERKLRAVSAGADLVVCPSEAARAEVARHLARFGRLPEMLTAPLGVAPPEPAAFTLPRAARNRDYFASIGTIEPRKNHALLLDVWEHFAATLPGPEIPALLIAGQRGWANETFFSRLDASPLNGRHVFELGGLDDGALAGLVAGATALLMPSLAEGFGLPPAEALALGTPALVSDLPVFHEILGNNPVYADTADMYSWAQRILTLAQDKKRPGARAAKAAAGELPTWHNHFNLVLKVT